MNEKNDSATLRGKLDLYTIYSQILSDMEIEKYSPLLGQIDVGTIFETAYVLMDDIQIIEKFSELISCSQTLELQDIHNLLENNIWLINDTYRLHSSNVSLKNIIDNEIQKKFKSKKGKRPDLICKNNFDDYVIIELKRPKHKITSVDFAQLLEYITIIKHHCPNWSLIDGYLIGSRFDESIRSKELELSGIHLRSYTEILWDLKYRYKRFLEILKPGVLS